MEIIGFIEIDGNKLVKIDKISDFEKSFASEIVWFEFNLDMLRYTNQNNIYYAVKVKNIKEAMLSNYFNANYIIVKKDIAKTIQKLANEYMFDSKVLQIVDSLDEIEYVAIDGIDGIVNIRS